MKRGKEEKKRVEEGRAHVMHAIGILCIFCVLATFEHVKKELMLSRAVRDLAFSPAIAATENQHIIYLKQQHGNDSRPAKGRGDRAEIYCLRLRRWVCNHVLFNPSAWEREQRGWKQETNISPPGLGHEHV